MSIAIYIARCVLVAAALGLWWWTQALLGKRGFSQSEGGAICDGVHQLTEKWNRRLLDNPARANVLLIASSAVIDILGFSLLGMGIFNHTIEPFVGLFMLFALRQLCQAFCPLPAPVGMIWRNPGFPSVLVTYGTTNDLFFSGHTAIAVYGSLYLGATFGHIGIVIGLLIAAFEIGVVLILRAHYTMDVFTGIVCALWVYSITPGIAAHVDAWLKTLVG